MCAGDLSAVLQRGYDIGLEKVIQITDELISLLIYTSLLFIDNNNWRELGTKQRGIKTI